MRIDHVEQLRVYGEAFEVAMRLFGLSKAWPAEERYALTDQARRSSRSVCANLAEAWAKRLYPRHFVSKLSDAHGEAAETAVWITFAKRCGYLSEADTMLLTEACQRIIGGLIRMMNQPDKWCGPSSVVREDADYYDPGT
ncbi:MAG TPA: four helix bundle protein [Rubricoccaceae bacterium]|nr:four helix bundle protein [Rubricoccaceae bacterium]